MFSRTVRCHWCLLMTRIIQQSNADTATFHSHTPVQVVSHSSRRRHGNVSLSHSSSSCVSQLKTQTRQRFTLTLQFKLCLTAQDADTATFHSHTPVQVVSHSSRRRHGNVSLSHSSSSCVSQLKTQTRQRFTLTLQFKSCLTAQDADTVKFHSQTPVQVVSRCSGLRFRSCRSRRTESATIQLPLSTWGTPGRTDSVLHAAVKRTGKTSRGAEAGWGPWDKWGGGQWDGGWEMNRGGGRIGLGDEFWRLGVWGINRKGVGEIVWIYCLTKPCNVSHMTVSDREDLPLYDSLQRITRHKTETFPGLILV